MVGATGGTRPPALPAADAAAAKALKAQQKYARLLEKAPQGVGHGVGLTANGQMGLLVFVESNAAAAEAALPSEVDGVPLSVVVVGRIVAF